MNREAIKRLLIAAGLALLFLLLTLGVVSPLHAATPPPLADLQSADDVRLEIASTPPMTVTLGQSVTLTAKIHNDGPITITDLNLTLTLPPWADFDTNQLTRYWDFLTPTQALTHSALLYVPEREVPRELLFGATLRYTISDTGKSIISHTQVAVRSIDTPPATTSTTTSPLLSPEPSPSIAPPTATSEPSPAPSKPPQSSSPPASPTPMASPSPPPSSSPIPSPTFTVPAPSPTPSPFGRALGAFIDNWPTAGLACLVPLLILGLLLILVGLRQKKPTAPPPTAAPPPPAAVGPHLESKDFSGGPQRFAVDPEGFGIGRANGNDLVITREFPSWETVSNHHARIYQQTGHWVIEDLNSMNGVYVNEKRTGRNLLHDGWRLSIGGVQFVFHTGTGEAQR